MKQNGMGVLKTIIYIIRKDEISFTYDDLTALQLKLIRQLRTHIQEAFNLQ